jgi:hypothetical protein
MLQRLNIYDISNVVPVSVPRVEHKKKKKLNSRSRIGSLALFYGTGTFLYHTELNLIAEGRLAITGEVNCIIIR